MAVTRRSRGGHVPVTRRSRAGHAAVTRGRYGPHEGDRIDDSDTHPDPSVAAAVVAAAKSGPCPAQPAAIRPGRPRLAG